MEAQKKLRRTRSKTEVETSKVVRILVRQEEMRTKAAEYLATSEPLPIAIPTSAVARAGPSLTPSPTMATKAR